MQNTARVHLLFRSASELTRRLRQLALACELAAAGVSLTVILAKPEDTAAWLPLAILAFVLASTVLRSYSATGNGFAQRCRKIALRAYCAGKEVDAKTVALLNNDIPLFVITVSRWVKPKPIEKYYDPTTPPGELRQAELYAHSAFFTWRQLRIQAMLLAGMGAVIAIGCGVLIYHLAAAPEAQADRRAVLEAVCTVVLLVTSIKGFESAWQAHCSAKEIQSIETALLDVPTGESLRDLIDSYDIERAAGANPMGMIYGRMSDTLTAEWEARRAAFGSPSPTPATTTGVP